MIAYLIHFFPLYSSTFITDEIDELRRQGAELALFAVLRPGPEEYPKAFDRFYRETTFVFPIHTLLFLKRHLAALKEKPLAYLHSLFWILSKGDLGIKNRIRTLYHFAEAIHLYPELKARGCRYLHVHFMVGTGTIAFFLHRIYGLDYSLTGHGGDIFEDRVLQAEKMMHARFTRLGTEYNAVYLRALIPVRFHDSLKVISFGIDRLKIPENGSKAGKVAVSPGRPWRILTVGRLVWEKAQHLLFEACAREMEGIDFHLTVVGEGPLRPALESQMQASGLASRVSLLGALPAEAVWSEYRKADLFVLSSISEGSPFVIMEAMACGLPVIAPSLRGIPEMVRDGKDGRLFKTGSAQDLGRVMKEVLSDPDLLLRYSQEAESSAKERFDQIKSITHFHSVLKMHAGMGGR